MPWRTDRRFAAVMLGAALVLTGCSSATEPPGPVPLPTHVDLGAWDAETSGNGLVLLDGASARSTMLAAMREAETVMMTGAFTGVDGRTLSFEVKGSSSDTVASFSAGDEETLVVVSDGQAYLGAGPGTLSCVPDDDPALSRWAALLHPVQTISTYSEDTTALGAPVDGTVDLLLGVDGTMGTLGVQTEGPPLPIALTRADAAGTLTITLSGWGETIEVPDLSAATGC